MIQMPLPDMIKKITEQASITEEEVNDKIKAKLDQLSGLISKEGAAHIIANELGVKLMPTTQNGMIKIKDIMMGMRNISVAGKVTNHFGLREFNTGERSGKVTNFIIGDETGTTRVVCWGDMADKAALLKPDTIIKLTDAYIRQNQGNTEVHLNDKSGLVVNPEGIEIAATVQTSPATTRKAISELTGDDANIELLGTVVTVYDPKFFEVCPDCNKRSKQNEEGSYICPEHGPVTPTYSYLMNLFIDDGTGNIQTVFFRNMVESLLKRTPEEVMNIKDSQDEIEKVKNDLLGEIIKIKGRATKNQMFERIEFIVTEVDTTPDPEDELKAMSE